MYTNEEGRQFLKAYLWEDWDTLQLDQRDKVPHPPIQKPYLETSELIDLLPSDEIRLETLPVLEAIKRRSSQRNYSGEPISLSELSYLLWATQGVHRVIRGGQTILRTVPSAGARHPFETYVFINHVEGIYAGLYRYLGIEHKLLPIDINPNLVDDIHLGTYEQYVHECAVVFIWTAIPYRTEWRYGPLAHKMIAQDSGHICQNLYLACESIGLGTCAIGAYNQKVMDRILGVDGDNEFTIYVATVGKIGT
jgi:SagB-type dehydrogenase family enzyme